MFTKRTPQIFLNYQKSKIQGVIMLRSKEIEVTQKVQIKFLRFTEKLSKILPIPGHKFIRDMMRGSLSLTHVR